MVEMKKKIENIIIVGGGPAGAYLGWLLAKKGLHPIIFDHSHPREKPCGGGISTLAIEKFTLLQDSPEEKDLDYNLEFISPGGTSVMTTGKKSGWVLSRLILDKFLLDKAIDAGCTHIQEQVIDVQFKGNLWHIRTNTQIYQTRFLIGADGANSIVRKKILGPIPKQDIGVCYGCFATSNKKEVTRIKYFEDIQGYAWCFPRHDHLSIGIGIREGDIKQIKKIFNDFITSYYPEVNITSTWGAKIPSIKNPKFYNLPCANDNWILVGDAAGHVDPTTGEGISYALWSAELAAKAILNNDPKSFDTLWRKEYGRTLIESCKQRNLFYNSHFLDYTIKLAKKSRTFSTFLYEYTMNQIPNKDLMKRIVHDLPKTIKEFVFSNLRPSTDT